MRTTQFSKRFINKLAIELNKVRKDNNNEGCKSFKIIMEELENNATLYSEFKKVIEEANQIKGDK